MTKPPIPDDPLEKILWYLTYTVEEKPQIEPVDICTKAAAMAAVAQIHTLREICGTLRQIRDQLAEHAAGTPPGRRRAAMRISVRRARPAATPGEPAPPADDYAGDPVGWNGGPHPFLAVQGAAPYLCGICSGGIAHPIHHQEPE